MVVGSLISWRFMAGRAEEWWVSKVSSAVVVVIEACADVGVSLLSLALVSSSSVSFTKIDLRYLSLRPFFSTMNFSGSGPNAPL